MLCYLQAPRCLVLVSGCGMVVIDGIIDDDDAKDDGMSEDDVE